MVTHAFNQLYYFFASILCGLCIGVMFDIYRIIRGFDSPGKVFTIISDILFWILAGLITFILLLYINNAQLQYSTFVALGIGIYIYIGVLSKLFVTILKWIIYYITKFLRILYTIIIYPFRILRYLFAFSIIKLKQWFGSGVKKVNIGRKNILNKFKKKKEKSN